MFFINQYMEINFNSTNYLSYLQTNNSSKQSSFEGASSRKLIAKIKAATQLKKLCVTFEELVNAYKEIGFDVLLKRGSHAVVPVSNKFNIPLIIPHGNKYVSPYDLKRFRFVLEGDYERASRV